MHVDSVLNVRNRIHTCSRKQSGSVAFVQILWIVSAEMRRIKALGMRAVHMSFHTINISFLPSFFANNTFIIWKLTTSFTTSPSRISLWLNWCNWWEGSTPHFIIVYPCHQKLKNKKYLSKQSHIIEFNHTGNNMCWLIHVCSVSLEDICLQSVNRMKKQFRFACSAVSLLTRRDMCWCTEAKRFFSPISYGAVFDALPT